MHLRAIFLINSCEYRLRVPRWHWKHLCHHLNAVHRISPQFLSREKPQSYLPTHKKVESISIEEIISPYSMSDPQTENENNGVALLNFMFVS